MLLLLLLLIILETLEKDTYFEVFINFSQVGSSWIWYQQASTHVRCRGRKGKSSLNIEFIMTELNSFLP